ncbi:MAG: winged helix-turn-helix domain-containing protein [Acidobacteriota bacterium]
MENKHLLKFEAFTINLEEKSLSKSGGSISIPPKVFAILEMLVKNDGRIVEKDELMKEVWADSFVEDSNLTYSIRQLRKILGDDFNEPKFIETVPRRGYRFIAKIESSNGNQVENTVTESSKNSLSDTSQKRIFYVAIAISVLLFGLTGYFYYQLQNSKNYVSGTQQQRLAILPFANLQPNSETDYLGFAFADTLNSKLTSMRTFKVFPSSLMTKYKNPQDFLNENESEYIVSGTYLKENGKLLITAQVFGTRNNETLFQDSFELDEEQLSQTSEIISRRLINELRLRPQEISKYADMSEINPQAYNHFLKGIEQYSRFQLAESIENLEKAVAIAPNFAAAWDKLGDSYLVSASTHFGGKIYYEKAEKCYRKSISLDEKYFLPQIHLTNILIETNRKEEAIEILLKALAADAENPMVWWELSYAYRFAGRLEKSIEAGEKAHQLDPGFYLNASAPTYYLYVGDYQKFKNAISRRTDSSYLKFYQGFAEYHLDNKEAAKQLFNEAYQLDSNSMQTQIGKTLSYHISGEKESAKELLLKIEKTITDKKVSDGEGIYKVAQAFAILGNNHKALQLLDLAVEKGFFCYPYFQNDPLINNLRNEKRFTEILEKTKNYHLNFKY